MYFVVFSYYTAVIFRKVIELVRSRIPNYRIGRGYPAGMRTYSSCTAYMRGRYGSPVAHAYSFGVHGFPKPVTYFDPVLSVEPVWWNTHLPAIPAYDLRPVGICGSACDCCDRNCKEGLTFVTEHCTEVYLHYFCINAAVVCGQLPRRISVKIVLTQKVTVFLWCKYKLFFDRNGTSAPYDVPQEHSWTHHMGWSACGDDCWQIYEVSPGRGGVSEAVRIQNFSDMELSYSIVPDSSPESFMITTGNVVLVQQRGSPASLFALSRIAVGELDFLHAMRMFALPTDSTGLARTFFLRPLNPTVLCDQEEVYLEDGSFHPFWAEIPSGDVGYNLRYPL